MNGIEKITQRIDAVTQGSVDSILSEAKGKAAEIEAKAKAEVEKLTADLRTRGDKDAAEREERLVSVAQMEARQISLGAKQEMMDKAFDGALEKLCGAADDVYADVCAKLLVKAAPDGTGEVIFAPDKKEVGTKAVAKANQLLGGGKLTLSGETRPIKGGFILRKGSVEVNCTFETLVRLQRSEASGEVAKLLFPEG